MAYKIKKSKNYYRDEELENFNKKKHHTFGEIEKEGYRYAYNYPTKLHKKGALIKVDGKDYAVKRVTSKGVYAQPIREDELDYKKSAKVVFISEKKLETKAKPESNEFYAPPIWAI